MRSKKRYSDSLSYLKNSSGQGLIEYALLLMLVTMIIVATLHALGDTVDSEYYERACSAIVNASN